MPLALLIRPGTDVPIYRQIVRQVVEAVATGDLAAGERMPSHRELAITLTVAPLTIKKAYDELEAAGFLTSRQGSGTFVSANPAQPPASRRRLAPLRDSARALAAESSLHGLTLEELLDLVRAAHARLENSR